MEFERVGGQTAVRVDVRLISTSNRSMKSAVEEKQFREDLYYRLNVIPLYLPPLCQRREDIILLAEFFLKRLCTENGKVLKQLSPEAKERLLDYHWPGNIRELANVIERTVVMHTQEVIEAEEIPLDVAPLCPVSNIPPGATLKEVEKQWILETLEKEKQNRTRTAQVLGISIRTLRNKLRTYQTS